MKLGLSFIVCVIVIALAVHFLSFVKLLLLFVILFILAYLWIVSKFRKH